MVEKRDKKFGQGPPPFSGNARKKIFFYTGDVPLLRGSLSLRGPRGPKIHPWWFATKEHFLS